MSTVENAIAKLKEQQGKVGARSAPWLVAEQLMDICRHEPASAELIAQDLDNPEMSIEKAEQQIRAYADGHKTGNFACVTPAEADDILRKFYGLPAVGDAASVQPAPVGGEKLLNLADFLG